jgi:branched-subunit amino acid aminotransferase/4-amino-4-deoxychorismate lyase
MTTKLVEITLQKNYTIEMNASSLDAATNSLPVGFYTTFSTLAGGAKALGLQAHLDRLYVPAKEMGLKPSVDEKTLRSRIAEIVKLNLPHETRVRLILVKESGRIYIAFQPFIPPPESVYEDGVHVITSGTSRTDPRIKGTDFITKSAEQRKLVTGDVYEILLVHNGKILEGMTSNFYAVKVPRDSSRGTLITAQRGILLGVTRRAVLKIARGEGLSIEYRAPRIDEKFDEAFLTSSSRGVVPIVKIDGQPVGEGKVGAWAKTLRKAYQAYVEERSERIV